MHTEAKSHSLDLTGHLRESEIKAPLVLQGSPSADPSLNLHHQGFHVEKGSDGSIEVTGEVDFWSAESFHSALSAAIPSSGICQIKLDGLRFIDSAGIGAIVRSARSATTELRLCSATPTLRKCWAILEGRVSAPNVTFFD